MPRARTYPSFAPALREGVSPRSRLIELLQNCARIGFNP